MLEIPPAAHWLLYAVGIKYQMLFVDADDIRAFAQAVRAFARRVSQTNDDGTQLVNNLADSWEGMSYEALVQHWAHMNDANMAELQEAVEFLAIALEAAATTVEIVQAAVVAELAALGAAFIGASIAAVGTMGASAAVSLAVRAAAQRLVSAMEQILVAYLLTEVLEAAIKPLEAVVDRIVNGYGRSALADSLGVSNRFRMDPPALERAANAFDSLAEQMTDHGRWLAEQLANLFQDNDIGDLDDNPYRGIIDMPNGGLGLTEVGENAAPPGVDLPDLTTAFSTASGGPDVAGLRGSGLDGLGGSDPYAHPPQLTPAAGPVAPNPNGAPVGAGLQSATPVSSADHEFGSSSRDERDIDGRPRTFADTSSTQPSSSTDVPWRTDSVPPEISPPGVAASAAPHLSGTPPPADAAPVPWAGARPDAASRIDENRPAPMGAVRPPGRPGKPRIADAARRRKSEKQERTLAGQQDPATADSRDVMSTPWAAAAATRRVAQKPGADRESVPKVRVVAPESRTDAPKHTDAPKAEVIAPEVTPPRRR